MGSGLLRDGRERSLLQYRRCTSGIFEWLPWTCRERVSEGARVARNVTAASRQRTMDESKGLGVGEVMRVVKEERGTMRVFLEASD